VPKLHWSWRVIYAAGVTYLFAVLTLPAVGPVLDVAKAIAQQVFGVDLRAGVTIEQLTFAWIIPVCIVAVLTFIAVTRWVRPALDNETRCRKCRYILRGITEPRCPECGEKI
jgi:hypothetical protein